MTQSALRPVLMISGGAWVLATLVAFTFNGRLLDVLERPIKGVLGHGHYLANVPIVTSITEPLTIPLKVSALAGLVLALPVILWQVWSFVSRRASSSSPGSSTGRGHACGL
jgi:sec-independent protein translocase protein TatC